MKRLLSLCVLVSLLWSCHSLKPYSLISGKWGTPVPQKLSLYKTAHGALQEIASTTPLSDGSFYFAFGIEEEGIYVVGNNTLSSTNNQTFYLKPGDVLQVDIQNDAYVLTGKNTPENKALASWHDFIAPLYDKSFRFSKTRSTYEDFFPQLMQKWDSLSHFDKTSTSNARFDETFRMLREYDMAMLCLHYLYSPRSAHPEKEDIPALYDSFLPATLTDDASLLDYPYGITLLRLSLMRYNLLNLSGLPKEQQAAARNPLTGTETVLATIGDPLIQGEYVTLRLAELNSYDTYLEYEQRFQKYLTTDVQRQKMLARRDELLKKEGTQRTVDFSFRDADGKMVSLSGLKGKVVYVDVWATWCGPCKGEIPHLKELEKAYHGKNVVFVSVSVDAEKDLEKWKKFVQDEKLGGVQLFAGDRSKEILNPYQITGIPRFMLFGKDGKVISSDAPRPSAKAEISAALDKALAQ